MFRAEMAEEVYYNYNGDGIDACFLKKLSRVIAIRGGKRKSNCDNSFVLSSRISGKRLSIIYKRARVIHHVASVLQFVYK